MVSSYSSTNVTLVATVMMVLMILSMCGTFDNVAAISIDSIFQRKRTTVTINNELGNTTHLSVECKSTEDHLARKWLNATENYRFSFRPNLSRSTAFKCQFAWELVAYWFVIYDYGRDHHVCSICNWRIFRTGPCEYSYVTKKFDLCHTWT
ncbi:S-protein homolog 2-like [Corylus avellana]|uniref:S-protein homolog 2-like n=1 Tax=Corylus avellana TaxID=13451 RepID=UPI00286AC35B|nr:S-protein homolog 2-like [Corylus avellana]